MRLWKKSVAPTVKSDKIIKMLNVENADRIPKTSKRPVTTIATAWQYKTGKNKRSKISHGTSLEIDWTIEPLLIDSWRSDCLRFAIFGTYNKLKNILLFLEWIWTNMLWVCVIVPALYLVNGSLSNNNRTKWFQYSKFSPFDFFSFCRTK